MKWKTALVSAGMIITCMASVVTGATANAAPTTGNGTAAVSSSAPTNGRTPAAAPAAIGRVPAADYYTEPPRTRKQRDDQALAKLGNNLSTATQLGALGGTVIGGIAGCVIGGIIIPAVGCIPGVITGAGFGAVVGTASAGGPVLIGNVNDYLRTIRSPFVPPKK